MDKEKVELVNGIYDIDEILYLFNLLRITFSEEVDVQKLTNDMSIFNTIKILTRGGQACGTYDEYNTIYKIDGNTVTLSNDGSVYAEPIIPEPLPMPEKTLDEIKNLKILELSRICNQLIIDGVDIDINGDIEHFSYKSEDQTNIKDAFDLALQTNMNIPYHNDGGGCKLYTSEQIINLYITEKTNLTHHTTYFNQMKMYINTLEDKEIIGSIQYGDPLFGEYLEAYDIAMNQASIVINALLGERMGE